MSGILPQREPKAQDHLVLATLDGSQPGEVG